MHIAWWLVVPALVAVGLLIAFGYRRRRLLGLRGAIEMSVDRGGGLRGGWVLGVASYAGDELRWYRMSSFRPGPSLRIDRRHTEMDGPSSPTGGDGMWMPPNPVLLTLRTPASDHTVAVPETAVSGLLSWWEAAGPTWRS